MVIAVYPERMFSLKLDYGSFSRQDFRFQYAFDIISIFLLYIFSVCSKPNKIQLQFQYNNELQNQLFLFITNPNFTFYWL